MGNSAYSNNTYSNNNKRDPNWDGHPDDYHLGSGDTAEAYNNSEYDDNPERHFQESDIIEPYSGNQNHPNDTTLSTQSDQPDQPSGLENLGDDSPHHEYSSNGVSTSLIPTKAFSFTRYLDSDAGAYMNLLKTNMFLHLNPDTHTPGLDYEDPEVDILICGSLLPGGIDSSLYEAFECYMMLKMNSTPRDLGGPNIKLMFTDIQNNKTDLGRNGNYGNEVLKAIYTKYDGSPRVFKDLENDLVILKHPRSITIRKTELPYPNDTYQPSNVVIIDPGTSYGPGSDYQRTLDTIIVADNLHMQIADKRGFTEEMADSKPDINFFCLYIDSRLQEYIPQYTNLRTIYYNDVKRIAFSLFRRDDKNHAKENTLNRTVMQRNLVSTSPEIKETYQSKALNFRRYLLYVTPGRTYKKTDAGYDLGELDDIIDSLRITDLNPVAKKIQQEAGTAQEILSTSHHEKIKAIKELEAAHSAQVTHAGTKSTKSTKSTVAKEQREKETASYEQAKIAVNRLKLIENTSYTLEDALMDPISIEFIFVGLTKETIDFEAALMARALQRGINAISTIHLVDTLPIDRIHSLYDVYIYTPTRIDWDGSSRFIPEAIYYGKTIRYTKMARKETSKNHALNLRIEDTNKHLSFLDEDDVFWFPKMQLTRNLLGFWV